MLHVPFSQTIIAEIGSTAPSLKKIPENFCPCKIEKGGRGVNYNVAGKKPPSTVINLS